VVIYVFRFAGYIISIIIGLSHLKMNKSDIILYIFPIFLFVVLANYLITLIGKTLGKDQSILIKKYITEAI
jgi:hypothetical protein